MATGERGPTGDHGQDGMAGDAGPRGAAGAAGATGETGKTGPAGKDVLTKAQTMALFLFVVFAFVLLAFRTEHNDDNIRDGVVEFDKFVQEICADHPEYAPISCAERD